jgi:hypothetical protein
LPLLVVVVGYRHVPSGYLIGKGCNAAMPATAVDVEM